jgi:predicted PurR-regulated permease PerM
MKEQEVVVHISTKAVVKVALFIGFCFLLFYMRDLLIVLLMAIVIASSVEPAAVFFEKYKIPRALSVLTIFAVVLGVFLTVIYLFIPIVIKELAAFIQTLPQMLAQIPTFFGTDPAAAETIRTMLGKPGAQADLLSGSKDIFSTLGGGVLHTTGAFFETIATIVLMAVIAFYLSVQEKGIENFLRLFTPKSHEEYTIDLWKRSQGKIAKWMQGQLVLGLIIGLLSYIGLSIIGVPYALLLAILAGLFELIPVIGPLLSMVPAALLALSSGGLALALSVVVLYLIIQQLENNVIVPMVMSKMVGLNSLLVILSLLVGAKLAGIWGMLLAVPVLSALMEYVSDVQKDKKISNL